MKKSIYIIVLIISVLMLSCNNGDDVNKYANPNWTFTDKAEYSVSMTAAVQLPENLNPFLTKDDQMVALVGEEIRGVANLYDGIFYIQILAAEDEVVNITFQYWSAKTQYKYLGTEVFPFKQDTQLGTPDNPLVINFIAI